MDCENEKLWIFCLFTKAQNDKCFAKQAQKPFASSKFVIMTPCLVILSNSEVSIQNTGNGLLKFKKPKTTKNKF